jgi:hypothetical protein
MVTRRLDALDAPNSPAPRRWRGVVRFVAWLTIFGAGALIALYFLASRHVALPHGTGVVSILRYKPFLLLRQLITGLSGAHFTALSLLFAPLAPATLSALFALGGAPGRRVILALLGLLMAAFNLFTCFSLVWAFSWNEAAAGVIDAGTYLALGASLIAVVLALGVLILALASAMPWPLLSVRGARAVARWWVALVVSGAALLIASYFRVWGAWRATTTGFSSPWAPFTPFGLYFSGPSSGQVNTLLLLFAGPVIAALSALLTLGAARWRRRAMRLLSLLAGVSSLVVCLILIGRLFLRASGSSVLDAGGVVGLGASILVIIAAFGLLSVPYPSRRRAPTTRLLAESQPLKAA